MNTLLVGGSVLAAFFGGAVALFSPCCIVFLLPAYLAAAVKNRRWMLLPLSLVFAAGIALVLLPITLGFRLLATSLTRLHTPLYFAGGLLLLSFAVLALLGKSWSMPSFVRAPSVERTDAGGIFLLGIFSGVASSCCAPVLAGVMTLSALSATPIGAASLGLSYVFGMVFPLFLISLAWDRYKLGERRLFQAKPVRLRLAGREVLTNTVNIGVAVAFAAMGAMVLVLATSGNTTAAPGFQRAAGRWLSGTFSWIVTALKPVPEPILGLGLLALAAFFVVAGLRRRGRPVNEGRSCHDEQEGNSQDASTGQEAPAEAPAARK